MGSIYNKFAGPNKWNLRKVLSSGIGWTDLHRDVREQKNTNLVKWMFGSLIKRILYLAKAIQKERENIYENIYSRE